MCVRGRERNGRRASESQPGFGEREEREAARKRRRENEIIKSGRRRPEGDREHGSGKSEEGKTIGTPCGTRRE
jgi:hypothetical protein